jgi:2-dehydro-3-deoxyglucarate aldolase/4-hydroxy-2-oxoheptanedioate aldolase
MKTQALRQFRSRLKQQIPVCGLWVTLEAPSITEMAVALGLDWLVIDAEHGHLDWREIAEHIRAAVRSSTVVLVRLQERDTALTKRALDLGADGIVIPWMESAAQLREAVRDCRYPPEGRRGIGGERATVWGQCLAEHTAEANSEVLVVPLIESVAAIPNVPEMCGVDGVDVFFFGPADFSASAGFRGLWEGPGVADQILQLKDTIRRSGRHCGVLATGPENLLERCRQGFLMPGFGSDAGLLIRTLRQTLSLMNRDLQPACSLDPRDGRAAAAPLAAVPERLRPDRDAVVTAPADVNPIELEPGVEFRPLAGQQQGARGLTTGIVTLSPAAGLSRHLHPCSESITVLEGELEMTVEGRVYRLRPLDNITIPRWFPHAARNPDKSLPTRLHIALATAAPERTLVSREFPLENMPDDSTGRAGAERVTRFAEAVRVKGVGPGAEFVDYFNAHLIPGLEMSGGFARFQPGGRLPAHVHDFDESICITAGTAACLVEGQRRLLQGCATAMVPRGRAHFFRNDSAAEMDMIWVYAGPLPERIVVAESCAAET